MAIRGQDVDFGRGSTLSLPHVAGADLKAGTVLVLGGRPVVTVTAIASGDSGSVYDGNGGSTVIGLSNGTIAGAGDVYWDDTAKKLTGGTGGAGNAHFGHTMPDQAATSDNDEVEVVHNPNGSVGT